MNKREELSKELEEAVLAWENETDHSLWLKARARVYKLEDAVKGVKSELSELEKDNENDD